MSNQSQNQNFYVVPIPQNITVLQSFKKWRRTGENLNGAIMIGVLENFLLNGQLEKIQSILNNLKSVSDDQIKKIKDCIEKSLQFPKGDQKLDYIMDYLKSSDPHNIFAEKLILEYVKRVKGNLKSDDELIKISKNLFSVQISVIRDDDQNNFNIILDPKDKDLIILYNFNSFILVSFHYRLGLLITQVYYHKFKLFNRTQKYQVKLLCLFGQSEQLLIQQRLLEILLEIYYT
ncbi:unnamed protein product [Paramecium sonneborni]|uniref:Uncharacterized protein n=1 Tax=Paramecium sonneborni TaxID=65129 RepID=A0A8S1QE66_9CILI|nr:unnamed protein product [Paramecium sonneborni]